ncbi:MAG: methyltransferase domain-containing protein [Dehalococcoidia bacterium]
MPPDRETIRRFNVRYSAPVSEASLTVEREVIGANVGANGYTTVPQADVLANELRLRPGLRLLDIGAGRGWPGLYLAKKSGCDVVMADLPLPGLAAALVRADDDALSGRVSILRATGERLPLKSGSFDAIVHTDTLCCIRAKLSVLRACLRALRPGGKMAFYTIFIPLGLSRARYRRAADAGPRAVTSWGRSQTELLGAAGFTVVREEDVTAQFLATNHAWYEGRERFIDELSEAEGANTVEERQCDCRIQERAIEDGLLRRGLFVAERPR